MSTFPTEDKNNQAPMNEDGSPWTGYGKKQMREQADSLLSSKPPNAILYMSDGSGYLYVSMLVYVCRAGKNMNAHQRNIITDFIQRYSMDDKTPSADIEDQLRRWITPSRQQFAINVNDIIESGNMDILREIYNCSQRLLMATNPISDLQQKALDKLAQVIKT